MGSKPNTHRPNWLLNGLIIVSFGIHVLVFAHVANLYTSSAMTYIEFALEDLSTQEPRDIPRPRHRQAEKPLLKAMERPMAYDPPMPLLEPINLETDQRAFPTVPGKKISGSQIPAIPDLKIGKWVPLEGPSTDYMTQNSYFDMVLRRIEYYKKYPDAARPTQAEGRTRIHFIIKQDGEVSSVDIIKSAGNRALDQAAVDAVRKASPFPRPPAHLFHGEISLKVDVVFKLI
ncbi:MAG: TonB family protein [Desulfatiglans sp.]|jgi:protein TonB|nr:TonB family protein [Thermodesulfobacteriota bacterium]MEE4352212.1 TonB family protein [Desulfatiglans sp.]